MDIPSTVAGYGGPPSKEPPVSSLEGRSVESRTPYCPSIAEPACDAAHLVPSAAEDMATRVASNAGQWRWWLVVHPAPAALCAPLFAAGGFFLPADKTPRRPCGVGTPSAASRRAVSRMECPPATVSSKIRRTTTASGSKTSNRAGLLASRGVRR
jgi:hypothetical protein